MEITLARKLLSYSVSLILLFFCKYSYDVHHRHLQLQTQAVLVQPEKVLPTETVYPQEQKTEPLQSGKSLDGLYIVHEGKTEPSRIEDTESENDEVKSSPKANTPKKAK